MLSQAAYLIPLLALWIWHPLRHYGWRWYALAVVLSALAGASPALLIHAMRETDLSYEWIAPLQVFSGGLVVLLALLLLWALLRDALWCVARMLGRARGTPWGWQPVVTLAGWGLATALSSWGVIEGTRIPQVREHTIELARLPAALDGLRVAVLADIHASPVNNADYVRALVQRTNAARPDLVVLPGDLVDGDAATQARHLEPLRDLRAPLGVFAAPGNHEYYSGYAAWAEVYRRLLMTYLENDTRVLDVRGHRLAISGIGDPAYGRLTRQNRQPEVPEGMPPDVNRVAALAREAQAEIHLLLAHQPRTTRDNAQPGHGIDLQISGHTHGGHMVGMDRWLVAPANDGFVRGLYDVNHMRLWVSSGAGLWAGFAVRLGVESSVDVLVLRATSATRTP